MRMLIQLASVGVQRAKDADFDTLSASPAEHGAGSTAKQVVEQRPVVVEKRPQQVRHGEGDMLPVAVGQDVLLFSNPLVVLRSQLLQAFDLQLWQKKREWVQSGEAQQ